MFPALRSRAYRNCKPTKAACCGRNQEKMTARVLSGELPARPGGKLPRDKGAARRRSKGAHPFVIPEDRHDLKVQGMIRAQLILNASLP